MKIKTELLQKMVAKAIQGASDNKMIPITSCMGTLLSSTIGQYHRSFLLPLQQTGLYNNLVPGVNIQKGERSKPLPD